MDVTPLVRKGQQIIQVYSGGVFKVSGVSYSGAVIVTPPRVDLWGIDTEILVRNFSPDHLMFVSEYRDETDVFLLGTGKVIDFLKPETKKALKSEGLNFEMMDTGAASRTYNVLMAEGRRVTALLLPSI